MKWRAAHDVVEHLRRDTQLYLPALSERRGFSTSRVEHLLNGLVRSMPIDERYLEVGTLEGRTLEAAANGNATKHLIGIDPCSKYGLVPGEFPANVTFFQMTWQTFLEKYSPKVFGCVFYDGLHTAEETAAFMKAVEPHLSDEAVLVLDDWDRESVRAGAFEASPHWQLLRECPEYTDGLSTVQHHFGYSFGVAVWGYRR